MKGHSSHSVSSYVQGHNSCEGQVWGQYKEETLTEINDLTKYYIKQLKHNDKENLEEKNDNPRYMADELNKSEKMEDAENKNLDKNTKTGT